ncbi:RraA family protein [Jiangella aurantiaca]|uniref:Putative 4-hydroxy-4-methyl-2-oxoglutarate aldolase n=1 Tax=Jiangella aurantiaca TaxID=2530373 RepID=A0A4R5AFA0_9ACTN|nr:RraA family protein [Jiangella aurantiaca]TDD70040.1 RraA family protein [Jiangella aurantiaca]
MHTAEQRAEIRRRFAAVGTSNVADVLDDLGRPDQGLAPSLAAVSGERLAGWAYTIRGQMRPSEGTGDAAKMQACQGIGPDEVAIWAGDGHGVCYFGELIALGLRERGCVGAVVDGGVRDLRWLRQHGFPVFARYRTPVQSIGRWAVTGWQEPVYLRGATAAWVRVHPGDFVLADEDGGVVVPAALVEDVLTAAERLTATEVSIRAALLEGLSLAECLARFGHV